MEFIKNNYIELFDSQFEKICSYFTSSISMPNNSCLLMSLDFLPSNGNLYHLETNVKQALGIDQWPYFDLSPLKQYIYSTDFENIVLLTTSTFYNGYTVNKVDSFQNLLITEFSDTSKSFSIERYDDMVLDIEYFENRNDTFFIFHRTPPTDFWKFITDKILYQTHVGQFVNMPPSDVETDLFVKNNYCNSSSGAKLVKNLNSIDTQYENRYVIQQLIRTDTCFGRRTDIICQAAIMNNRFFNITKDKFYHYHYESFTTSPDIFNMFSSYGSIVEGTLIKLIDGTYKMIDDITDEDTVEFWHSPDVYSMKTDVEYLKQNWYTRARFDIGLVDRLIKDEKRVLGKFETTVLSYTQISENVNIARGNKSILNYNGEEWQFSLTENLSNNIVILDDELELIDISEILPILSIKKCYKLVLDGHNLNCGFFNLNGKLILTD
jgi:hypothetical protein